MLADVPRTTIEPEAVPEWSLVVPSAAYTRTRQVLVATPSTVEVVRHTFRTPSAGKIVSSPLICHVVLRPRITSGADETAR